MPSRSTNSPVCLIPAVSHSFTGMPPMEAVSLTRSRVVPGVSVTMARPCSSRRLNRLLLPTLGRPTMASVSPCRTRPPYWKLSASWRVPCRIGPIVLHLRPGAREWFLAWLAEHHTSLVPRYRELYGTGAYAPKAYQRQIGEQVRSLAERYGVGRGGPGRRAWRAQRAVPSGWNRPVRNAAAPNGGAANGPGGDGPGDAGPVQLSLL